MQINITAHPRKDVYVSREFSLNGLQSVAVAPSDQSENYRAYCESEDDTFDWKAGDSAAAIA